MLILWILKVILGGLEKNLVNGICTSSFYWEKDHFYAEISYTRAPYGYQSMKLATDMILYFKMAI
eukprot:snap_masked-scaffold_14-processed-gene-11.22-mRNA-1 protein AED:1.00 eAED:1.00 QI:0/0/0/0/1/1/2/0/64